MMEVDVEDGDLRGAAVARRRWAAQAALLMKE
ncbi:hypothetical protein AB7M37_003294 [Sinorhizobium fredii]